MADLIDPRSILAGQEVAPGHKQRGERRAPCPLPVLLGNRGFGPVNGLGGGFEIDPRIRQAQPQGGAPLHGIDAEGPPQLGQQRVEPGVDRGRVRLAPQRLGQLIAGDLAVPVDDQVGEQQPALRPGSSASSRWPSRSITSGPQIWMRAGRADAKVTPNILAIRWP